MAPIPAASDIAMVRCTCTGSPQPAPASSTTGSAHTARMSSATWIISVSERFASVTHFSQPSEPPERYTALKPASSAMRAMSGFSATGATIRSFPFINSLKSILILANATGLHRTRPARELVGDEAAQRLGRPALERRHHEADVV